MWQILEESLTTYRQEWDNLLLVASPTLVLGPIAALVVASGILAAVVALPVFLLLCIFVYAACARAEVLILNNLTPDPGDAYLSVMANARDVFHAAVPSALALAAISGAVLAVVRIGEPLLAIAAIAAGALGFLFWTSRHAYDQPLIFVQGITAKEALSAGARLAHGYRAWTLILVIVLSSPLLVAALVSWGVAMTLTPALGGAAFCLGVALWLPLFAVGLTNACAQLAGAKQ